MMVQHHEKYEEIHGEDKIVMMDADEHRKLHTRLRKEGKCTIPAEELQVISQAAYARTDKGKEAHRRTKRKQHQIMDSKENCLQFYETIKTNVMIVEKVRFNPNTGAVWYSNCFRSNCKAKLRFIDI